MDETVPRQTQEQQDYIQNWPMPAIEVGEPILWFSSFQNPNSRCHAFVTRVSQRSIECRVASGEHTDHHFDVLHRDDPRLLLNVNMQRNGCWEYAPITARLRKLEETVNAIKNSLTHRDMPVEDKPSAASQRAKLSWERRRAAKELETTAAE